MQACTIWKNIIRIPITFPIYRSGPIGRFGQFGFRLMAICAERAAQINNTDWV